MAGKCRTNLIYQHDLLCFFVVILIYIVTEQGISHFLLLLTLQLLFIQIIF